jgi:hypothetical protein
MSAAFSLDFSGEPVPCDFPGCTLDSFHAGEHEFPSAQELNERAAAAVTSYGVDTRSYNRSAEKREIDRQREIATARYESVPHQAILAELRCPCPQRPFPHELSIHFGLRQEAYNPQFKFRWPWSLCASERLEPSAEKEVA